MLQKKSVIATVREQKHMHGWGSALYQRTVNPRATSLPIFSIVSSSAGGYYMYVEASFPRRSGDIAILSSPVFQAPTDVGCQMTFYYHMQGSGQGTLDVLVILDASRNYSAFNQSGNQGASWKAGQVLIPVATFNKDYQVGDTRITDLLICTNSGQLEECA